MPGTGINSRFIYTWGPGKLYAKTGIGLSGTELPCTHGVGEFYRVHYSIPVARFN